MTVKIDDLEQYDNSTTVAWTISDICEYRWLYDM